VGSAQWQEAVFVEGQFRKPARGGTMGVRDKASGEIFATAGLASEADVDQAVAAAKAAQPAWAQRSYAERATLLRAAAAVLTDRAKELRELIMRETGCIAGKADYEIGAAASELIEAAGLASRATGEVLPTGHAGRFSLSERIPVGVVGVITPWNFPLVLGMRVIAPALALGNAVLIKPSPETPLSGGLAIAGLFEAAGLPEGVFSVLPGDVEVGQRLVTHPDVAMIHFTGSTCITAGRHIVQRGIAEAYTQALAARAEAITVGNTVTEDVGLGPMINERQLNRAVELLAEAVADGAKIVAGGTTEGPFFRPTVVTDVPRDSRLWTEEIFAPIAPIGVVDDADDAVAVANNTSYGLVDSVLTDDPNLGLRLARRLRAGMVHVNDATPQDEALAPFGGIGQSGLGGRSGGDSNIEEFTERRWLTVNPGPAHYPY
jgi:benzaldehyde dehydrogenase (NAD)